MKFPPSVEFYISQIFLQEEGTCVKIEDIKERDVDVSTYHKFIIFNVYY